VVLLGKKVSWKPESKAACKGCVLRKEVFKSEVPWGGGEANSSWLSYGKGCGGKFQKAAVGKARWDDNKIVNCPVALSSVWIWTFQGCIAVDYHPEYL